jgi:ABC-type sugar transport system permease subunit
VFIAALNTISPSIYEAAKMEGATSWEEFWKITFPMVSPYILTNVVYSIVDSLSAESSPVLSLILKISQSGSVDIALGSAMSIMFFGVELVFLAIMVFIISRIVFYYD